MSLKERVFVSWIMNDCAQLNDFMLDGVSSGDANLPLSLLRHVWVSWLMLWG